MKIYDVHVGLDWHVLEWWRLYATDYYDGQHHTIRLGPINIYWVT